MRSSLSSSETISAASLPSTPGPAEFSPDSRSAIPRRRPALLLEWSGRAMGTASPSSHPLAHARTVADIERYPWPDPAWMDVSRIRDEALSWGGRFAILGGDWSPFYHDAIDLLGMETLHGHAGREPGRWSTLCSAHLVDYYFQTSACASSRRRPTRSISSSSATTSARRTARSSARPSSAASSSPTWPAWPRWATTSASRS